MGLEPTTFCMAKAGGRSRPFACVRRNLTFAASSRVSERERSRANAECSHCSHCDQCPIRPLGPPPSSSRSLWRDAASRRRLTFRALVRHEAERYSGQFWRRVSSAEAVCRAGFLSVTRRAGTPEPIPFSLVVPKHQTSPPSRFRTSACLFQPSRPHATPTVPPGDDSRTRPRRARSGPSFDAERATGAAHERRLPGAKLAGDGDNVTDAQLGRESRRGRLGLLRRIRCQRTQSWSSRTPESKTLYW
jgi:hypothetical protein